MSAHPTDATPVLPTEVQYRAVADFPGYRVGDDGSLWSRFIHTPGRGMILGDAWTRLVCPPDDDGYRRVVLCSDRRRRTVGVHRLVALAFLGQPTMRDAEVCHGNGDPGDNRVGNLRWGTRLDNAADRAIHGTLPLGTKNPSCKLTEDQVREIRRRRAAGETNGRLAVAYGVSYHTVSAIVRRVIWKHLEG